MALDIKGLKRVFILKKGNGTLTLEDPDSRMSLSEVTDFYSKNHHRNERISHGKENKP